MTRERNFAAMFGSIPSVRLVGGFLLLGLGNACSNHHWAQVKTTEPLPPAVAPVLHTSRLLVDLSAITEETECLVYEDNRPVCFYNLRPSLEKALLGSTWSAYPSVVLGTAQEARPGDYVLQVEMSLDALPPDASGPGWSTGARSRFRLLRDGKTLTEETLSSRSRPDFAYGAPLGEGASEVVDATVLHIAEHIAKTPEERAKATPKLPSVAMRIVSTPLAKSVPRQAKANEAPDELAAAPALGAASPEAEIPASAGN